MFRDTMYHIYEASSGQLGKCVHMPTFASRSAIRYLGPSFSSSAMTQSVMHGVAFASRQSIMALIISSLFCEQPHKAHAAGNGKWDSSR
jgi:hypothetical protein